MIPQDQFVQARSRDWVELDALVLQGASLHKRDGHSISRAAGLYRSLCNDLTRAESARYSPDLLAYLHALAGRTHNIFYDAKPLRLESAFRTILVEFPVALRRNYRLFFFACALFLVPYAVGLIGALTSRSFSEGVIPSAQLDQMADMYSQGFSKGRDAGQDARMAGFYVQHNVGIALRCFGMGILLGLGSIYTLVYNGLVIGTVTGHVMQAGFGSNIWTFMCGHGPYEITAIFIAGGAGLEMGYSLIVTRGLTRFGSLKRSGRNVVAQIVGAAVMLVIAAGIEAFWSPSAIPDPIKWAFSALNMTMVVLFLALAGRGSPEAQRAEWT